MTPGSGHMTYGEMLHIWYIILSTLKDWVCNEVVIAFKRSNISGICLCVHSVEHNKLRLIQGVWFNIKQAVENAGLSFTLIINEMKYWWNSGNLGSFYYLHFRLFTTPSLLIFIDPIQKALTHLK